MFSSLLFTYSCENIDNGVEKSYNIYNNLNIADAESHLPLVAIITVTTKARILPK